MLYSDFCLTIILEVKVSIKLKSAVRFVHQFLGRRPNTILHEDMYIITATHALIIISPLWRAARLRSQVAVQFQGVMPYVLS